MRYNGDCGHEWRAQTSPVQVFKGKPKPPGGSPYWVPGETINMVRAPDMMVTIHVCAYCGAVAPENEMPKA